jgi:hypothetical protein
MLLSDISIDLTGAIALESNADDSTWNRRSPEEILNREPLIGMSLWQRNIRAEFSYNLARRKSDRHLGFRELQKIK